MPPQKSYVQVIEQIDRIDHSDSSGGGEIVRTFYIEPYTSYPFVELALKGTIIANGDGTYSRVKPHNDPVKPWYYCNDVQTIPFSRKAVRGSRPTGFVPSNDLTVATASPGQTTAAPAVNSQNNNIRLAANALDDFDFSANPDSLTPAEIVQGGPNYSNYDSSPAFVSKGVCGAFVTATYRPLIFVDGLSGSLDPFDYVNPVWTPIEVNTQVGRNLFFYSPSPAGTGPTTQGGLLDTFTKPEVIWQLSITRLMVPFLPKLSFGILNNKINSTSQAIGNIAFPNDTVRFVSPEPPPLKRAPDGATFYDITLKYLFRIIWDEFFDPALWVPALGQTGANTKGFITWNHHFGVPSARIWPNAGTSLASYYPVVWNGGLFQMFGDNHPLYLEDTAMQNVFPLLPDFKIQTLPFLAGFKPGQ